MDSIDVPERVDADGVAADRSYRPNSSLAKTVANLYESSVAVDSGSWVGGVHPGQQGPLASPSDQPDRADGSYQPGGFSRLWVV
jgi:hypothetical protein